MVFSSGSMVSLPSEMHFVSAVPILKKKSPEITAFGLSASGSPPPEAGTTKVPCELEGPLSPCMAPAEKGVPGPAGVTGGAAQMDCTALASDVPGPCLHTPIKFLLLSVH